jgi:peptidoglycan hydrolase-like protein with peptidoglycan-binding domain
MNQITGNENGSILESQINALLVSKGYAMLTKQPEGLAEYNWAIKQYRKFSTLYGGQMRIDFFVCNRSKWPEGLAIECKWQSSPGTVDEKFPYVVENLKALPVPSIIMLAGGGYRPAALEWVKRQSSDRLTVVESIDSAIKWAKIYL